MADVNTRFKTFLQADSSIAAKVASRVHDSHVPRAAATPPLKSFIYFRRRQTTHSPTLDSAAGEVPQEFAFDVEVVEADSRKPLGELVRARCNCFRGTFADSTCQAIFVNDHDDDYQPYNVGGDTGVFVTALDVTVHT